MEVTPQLVSELKKHSSEVSIWFVKRKINFTVPELNHFYETILDFSIFILENDLFRKATQDQFNSKFDSVFNQFFPLFQVSLENDDTRNWTNDDIIIWIKTRMQAIIRRSVEEVFPDLFK
jgi:hypothetical protein